MNRLTEEKKKKYMNENDKRCPYCEGKEFDYDVMDWLDDMEYWRIVTCRSCGRQWRDVYKIRLMNVEEYPYESW